MMRLKWLLILLIAFALTSCNKKEELKCEIPNVNAADSQISNKSDNLNVAIYVDGSGSMLRIRYKR